MAVTIKSWALLDIIRRLREFIIVDNYDLNDLSPLDREIQNLERAFRRARIQMNELEAPFSFPGDCCPSCACGHAWHSLAEKRERQAFTLARLYMKRYTKFGSTSDVSRAEYLYHEYGSNNKEWSDWRVKAGPNLRGEP